MKSLARFLKDIPWLIKLLLVIFWGVYGNLSRLVRSSAKNNVVGIILAVLLLLCGGFIVLWILDIIFVATKKEVWWID